MPESAAAAEPKDGGSLYWEGKRWENNVIPYVVDETGTWGHGNDCVNDGVVMSYSTKMALVSAILQLEALTPLRFEYHSDSDPPEFSKPYVIYRGSDDDDGGFALVRGAPKDGSPNCVYLGNDMAGEEIAIATGLHESVHVAGFDHEQQRPDRDTYVTFNGSCLDSDTDVEKLFDINYSEINPPITPYDLSSIMHYGSYWDDACEIPPLLRNDPNCAANDYDCRWIYQSNFLSVHDVNALWRIYEEPIGTNNADDDFGNALATGDFDDDGYLDLAIGAPGNNAVFIFKGTGGSAQGKLGRLVAWKAIKASEIEWSQPYTTGRFGASLAAGDFDGDGHTDLAIGAPGENQGTGDGTVFVYRSNEPDYYSVRRSLSLFHVWNRYSLFGSVGTAGDHFGAALAAGNFDNDERDDLAIGVPQRWTGSQQSGEVLVVLGKDLNNLLNHAIQLKPSSVPGGVNRTGARFGAALAAGNLDPTASATDDLVVGSPEQLVTPARTGAVYVFKGNFGGTFTGKQILVPSGESSAMRFGAAVAIGDFTGKVTLGKRERQLAIGAPYRNKGLTLDAGAVYLFKPSSAISFDYTQHARVEKPFASADDNFGDVIATYSRTSGADSVLAGLPNTGVGQATLFTAYGATMTQFTFSMYSNPDGNAGDGFGTAVAVANLLPAFSDGSPGEQELIIGAPMSAYNETAGSVWLYNYEPSELSPWRRYTQETANPD